jgi:monovalent cation/hydrogen antiporter
MMSAYDYCECPLNLVISKKITSMTDSFMFCIGLVLAILLLVMLAQKIKTAYPIILVIGGLLLSLIPGLPRVSIDPELIFIIFLPPLLYEAAWYTSWKDFWRWRRVISSFAFLVVLITSLVVAIVSNAIIPGFSLALGFLLGGIVSPPDAVSATSILKQIKVPRRITSILAGESLMNDASSLIVFRFALIAVSTGQFVFHRAALSFVVVIVGGIAIGLAIAMIYYLIHKWMPTDTNIDVILTLTAPYTMYIIAEKLHVSGVLAVVSGGLFLSIRSHLFLSHRSRLRGINVWSSLAFVLNGLVFMLIGLELPAIVSQLGNVSLGTAIGYGLLITVLLIVARILCTLGASAFTVFISRYITTADSHPGWRGPIVIGWAGMRGVVSLAAALSIPLYASPGVPFPQRNLILFITFMVILLTLVVQGLTLPLVIRLVKMEDPDHYVSAEEQDIKTRKELASKSLAFLDQHHEATMKDNHALLQLRAKLETEGLLPDPEAELLHADYRRVYLQLLARQRLWLLEMNKHPDSDEEIIRRHQGLLDLEEEKIRIRYDGV